MTLSEFKAWFEGYTEAMDGAPTEKQWKRIKQQVKGIDGEKVTERVFLDRYWPSYPRRGIDEIWCSTEPVVTLQNSKRDIEFDARSAMYSAGKAEALAG